MNALARKTAALLVICVFFGNLVTPIVSHAGSFGSFGDETQENFERGMVMCAATAAAMSAISFIPGINVPTLNSWALVKETIFDCLFWGFKNAIIQEMTGSTIQWVQSGMAGNPAFVQNIRLYLRSVADQVAGTYIENFAASAFLCSPFKFDIQVQLNLLYRDMSGRGLSTSCTLTESMENVQAFLDGDFRAGGWDGWLSIFENPQNNPYGAYFDARGELMGRINASLGEAQMELEFSNGFFSKKTHNCFSTTGERLSPEEVEFWGAENLDCEPPTIVTPGSQIKDSLEKAFGVHLDNIASADEFDEIFNLLAAWLISDILTEVGGLAGYDPSNIDHTLPPPPQGGDLNDSTPGDDAPAGPLGPSACFVSSGDFHTPTPGNEVRRLLFPLPHNTSYDRVLFDFDVTHGGWSESVPDARYELFWLVRDRNKNMFGYSAINAPNAAFLRHGLGQSHGYKPRVTVNAAFEPGRTYHLAYVYEVEPTPRIELIITDKETGARVARMTSTPDVPGINVGRGTFLADFGFDTAARSGNPIEVPSYGWRYSNAKVQFIGEGPVQTCQEASIGPGGGGVGNEGGGGGGGGGRPIDVN